MKKDDDYIEYLEKKLLEYENKDYLEKTYDVNEIMKYQEEYLLGKIYERENYLNENGKLWSDNGKLLEAITLNNLYIEYLLHSKWWKISNPFRKIYRKFKNRKYRKINYLEEYNENEVINDKVSIIIFSNINVSNVIDNIKNQKGISDYEIIIVGKDKKYDYDDEKVKNIILDDKTLTNDRAYIKILPEINGEYVAIIDESKVINSDIWLYQAIIPLIKYNTLASVFFNAIFVEMKKSCYYKDLKQRMQIIDNTQVLFLPKSRDLIQFIDPYILGKSCIIVKKRISNYYLM